MSRRPSTEQARRRPGSESFVESTSWMAWLTALVTSGIVVIAAGSSGLYVLAAAIFYMFGLNVWNAWVLIPEVAE
jgi:hypothetical protein